MTIKVLVLTATNGEGSVSERAPWIDAYDFTQEYHVAGCRDPLLVSPDGLGVVSTGIGKTAAATTVAGIFASDLDLSKTYVFSTGIAGGPPSQATPGGVYLADSIVDWDLKYRFDGAGDTAIDLLDFRPTDYVYSLNDRLVEAAFRIASDVELSDSPAAGTYRDAYGVDRPPVVGVGPSVCGDEFWHGDRLAEAVEWLLNAYGVDSYRTVESEDSGTTTALTRVDRLDRYLSIRGISNFDRPAPGQSPAESLDRYRDVIDLAIENSYRVTASIAEQVVSNWSQWRAGPPG